MAPDGIKRINDTPMDLLRFKDFLRIKVGRDRFSSMRLPALEALVTDQAATLVWLGTETDAERAVAIRWMLRGLDPEKAVRKARTDAIVSQHTADTRWAERYLGPDY